MGDITKTTSTILGKIAGLFREFNKLAALGGTNSQALTKNLPANIKSRAPDTHEGMLGSLILEHMLSPVFSQVAADFMISTQHGSVTGAISALDFLHGAGAVDGALADKTGRSADDARYKKGAGKGTEALLFGATVATQQNCSKPALLFGGKMSGGSGRGMGDRGRGYFTSPFNSRAQKRLESALMDASQQLMNLEHFEAAPA